MFLGQYCHTIDEKGRLTIPARFREMISEGAYITLGFDTNLMVLTSPMFQSISQRVNQLSLTEPKGREFRRLIFSTAHYIQVDRTGRILLPQFLRELAQIDGEVMVIGSGNFFEVWPLASWEAQYDLLKDAEANARRFEGFNLSSETS